MVKVFDESGKKITDTDLEDEIRKAKRNIKKEKKKLRKLAKKRNDGIDGKTLKDIKNEIGKFQQTDES